MANTGITVPDELLEDFDDIIFAKKAAGELPRDASRSHVIRGLMEEYVEGNGSISETSTIATAD
ncbi:CopG family ribbon-helix-helix protein [Haloprofundus salilacus]|uniref:CopG family ribbon-helix-helix protein n=1 Tax=Haloprofundus salilacus TaxID=2876190 RepID=UPI001CCEB2CA|nr:ribbon-helix-helix domain-containing protein [Haloprofundus salilacus]